MGEPTNTSSQAPFEPSRRQLDIFEKAGISPAAARAIADIDVTMRRVRRNVTRRELTSAIVASIDPELEISHLDVLEAINNWRCAEPVPEVTVGLVAERLNLDPSRASRLVGEVVDKGLARRVASQADARRTCLEPTDAGRHFAEEFRERKWRMLSAALASWSEKDIVTFARLFERFSHWTHDGRAALLALAEEQG
jgi:DNA-binding MarR family transcriptional regulator